MEGTDEVVVSESVDGGSGSNAVNGELNAFGTGSKVLRSPVLNKTATSTQQPEPPGANNPVVEMLTPKSADAASLAGVLLETSMSEVRKRVNELYEFIKDRNNVHTAIKQMVNGIKSSTSRAEREHSALMANYKMMKMNAEIAEKGWKAAIEEASRSKRPETPKIPGTKRDRDSPGEEEDPKKQKQTNVGDPKTTDGSAWKTIEGRKKKKEKKQAQTEETQKPRPRRNRNRGDALAVEVKEGFTYADLLRKVRTDPELKKLGENVVKTRRTQKGEMLFELKKDPAVKSSAFKSVVEKALGVDLKVWALSSETTIECRNLDGITTEEELKEALEVLLDDLKDAPITIRIRKAYGDTQTASIRLSTTAANKLLAIGKVKVGWSVCSLKLVPWVSPQMTRCYRCMGFGHQASSCNGPDRSRLCRKCGEEGHMARDCNNKAQCMLCKKGEGNSHATGGFHCPVYKLAASEKK